MRRTLRSTVAALVGAAALGVPPATASPPSADARASRDTTVAVRRGDALLLTDVQGELVIETWERDEVRAAELEDPDEPVRLVRTDAGITVSGRNRDGELRVDVPAWLPVEVRGREVDVEVRGTAASLQIRTVEGDVYLSDVSGTVRVQSLDGEIRARDISGEVDLRSVDDDVFVWRATGRLRVASTDGDLVLEDVDVETLDANTTDGDIRFSGTFRAGGSYALVTHSGDVVADIPAGSDVEVTISTFDGELEAGFPVTLDRIRSGRETRFTLGDGGARLSLEAFDGDIVLRRPGG